MFIDRRVPLRHLFLVALVGLIAACSSSDKAATVDVTNEVTTSSTVADSTSTTSPAPTSPAPTTTTAPLVYDFSEISPIVQGFVDERGLNGAGLIVVDRDDGVVYQEYWGEFDADRISLVASSSKMIVAGVLLRLQDDGLLDIDAPVADAVDWGPANPAITPAELLSNSSGLVGLFPEPTFGPYICQYLPAGSLQECAKTIFTTPDDDSQVVAPDTEFRYGGAQWQVAGAVAEAVSGRPWAQLIDEIYTQPCELETLGFNNHFTQLGSSGFDYPTAFNSDPSTLIDTLNPNMEGGAYVSTGDYAKLLLMHLRGGMCDDNRVLTQNALDLMHADRIGDAYGGNSGELGGGGGYGMGWWVDQASGRITDPGAYGAVPWLDLADGFGAYLVIESDAGTGLELAGLLYGPVEEAISSR